MAKWITTVVFLLLLIGGGCSGMDIIQDNNATESLNNPDSSELIAPPPTYLDLSASEIVKIFQDNEDDFEYVLNLIKTINIKVAVAYIDEMFPDGIEPFLSISPEAYEPYGQELRDNERFMACMWNLFRDCGLKGFYSSPASSYPPDYSHGLPKLYFGHNTIEYDPVMSDEKKARATGVLKEDWYYFAYDQYGNILDENGIIRQPDPGGLQNSLDLLESTPAPTIYPDLSPSEIVEIFRENEAGFGYLLEFAETAEEDIRVGYCDELVQDGGEPYLSIWPEPYAQKLRKDEKFIACMWKLLGDCRLVNLVLYSARHYPEADDHRPPVLGFGKSIDYNQDMSDEGKATATGVLKEDWYYFAYDKDGNILDEDGNVK